MEVNATKMPTASTVHVQPDGKGLTALRPLAPETVKTAVAAWEVT